MVPCGLGGERQLLRTGLRQGAGRYPQERLVSRRLARERQLLHSLRVRNGGVLATPAFSSDCQVHECHTFWRRRTNVWRGVTSPTGGAKRLRTMAARPLRDAIPRISQRQAQARETRTCDWLSFATRDCSPCAKALASRPVFSAHATAIPSERDRRFQRQIENEGQNATYVPI